MTTNSSARSESAIIGTEADNFITVEHSVSFQWVPAAGDASTIVYYQDYLPYKTTTGPSTASGVVTFYGATSSSPFRNYTRDVSFSFTDKNIAFPNYDAGIQSSWIYDPATGVLDPYMFLTDEDTPDSAFMSLNTVIFWRHDWSGSNLMDTEHGHWQLVPAIHNVDIFAGAGNDIILGGQGNETLDGGDGNDLIRASAGDDLILGGAGNDKLHAGVGNQTLTGGTGNDTIWGGTGTQILLGEQGRDIIYGGSGKQTLMGGAGNDLLWGGSGIQFLEGGDGSDVLHAGIGNETLSGGSGRDTFVFSAAAIEHDVVTDFHLGQDMITIAADFGALTIVQPRDLLPLISADAHGDAVLTVGSGFRLDLQHVAAQRVELHPSEFFRIA